MLIKRGTVAADKFTTISNAAIRDSRLSLRARGLLTYLLSHRQGWSVSRQKLEEELTEGQYAIRQALSELEKCGYLKRIRERGLSGKWTWSAVVTDQPTIGGLSTDGSTTDGSSTGGSSIDGKPTDKYLEDQETSKEDETRSEVVPIPALRLHDAINHGRRRRRAS